jgi:hypothetical protein
MPKTWTREKLHKAVFIGHNAHKIEPYDDVLSFSSGSIRRPKVLKKRGNQYAYNTLIISPPSIRQRK